MKLAYNEAIIALVKIYQQYTFSTNIEADNIIELVPYYVITPKEKMMLEVHKREVENGS